MFSATVCKVRFPAFSSWAIAFRALAAAIVLVTLAPLVQTVNAQPELGASAVNSPPMSAFISVWSDGVDNYDPVIAYNTRHNEYLVVWWNYRIKMSDVYARRVASDGRVLSWFSVTTTQGKSTQEPAVVYNPLSDEYFVVYEREDSAGDYNIYAKRITWNGDMISSEITIAEKAGNQVKPAVAYNSIDDEYLVVYHNAWPGGLLDIDAQRVRASNGALLSRRKIATAPNTLRTFPEVAYLRSENQYLIAYRYMSTPTSDGDIYAKTASANLFMLSGEMKLVDNAFHQSSVSIASGPNEYVAVWEDGPGWGHNTIYGRRIGPNGALSPYFRIQDQVNEAHYNPFVTYSPVYGYMVTWCHLSTTATGRDVYARFLRPGTNDTGDVFALDKSPGNQDWPALMCADDGSCMFAESHNGTGQFDIWARMIEVLKVYAPTVLR